MKKKRKKTSTIEYHQHVNTKGQIYGKAHPINAIHQKEKTQQAHNHTISLSAQNNEAK